MRMRESSACRCRPRIWWWSPAPAAAVVLVLLLLITTSSSTHVADGGVRTTPRAYGPGDAGVLDDAEAPAAAGGARRASSRATYKFPADRTSEDEGSLVVVEEDRRWWLKDRAATGSRLPDCAHACGPCSPCRRVIVSFRCALMASESCPIAYRCMCRGRFFRVPSP
ncbi:hypothetical protein BDA96_06G115400 [Sorghum bicolor]|uniref:Epidermal patterning factor-like protein n=2 Tax=Sorghum bicolor TaxID=4558 RepID=A0A921UBN0_SORBI|nr:uncharacterized protein LOC8057466 [Sorghum bicolor]KAG0526092.1 hypothetical protein BDA96_06G115400 [Sorghum bicolor]KXG26456.1 hypothetical protein SORBI_3006G104400 [Sorghum bicolor]|eukprot:XP_002446602.2 uncharacterized protein LOC8057466 [Sorghum bicolor]